MKRVCICVIAVLLASCSGVRSTPEDRFNSAFDGLREAIVETIPDSERAGSVLASVDELEVIFREAVDAEAAYRSEFARLNRDYDATEQQFDALYQKYEREYSAKLHAVLELKQAIVEQTTAEEWTALSRHRNKVLKRAAGYIESAETG